MSRKIKSTNVLICEGTYFQIDDIVILKGLGRDEVIGRILDFDKTQIHIDMSREYKSITRNYNLNDFYSIEKYKDESISKTLVYDGEHNLIDEIDVKDGE